MEFDVVYEGTIKMFNKQFGFIESKFEDIYFHKSGIESKILIEVGDKVSFYVEKSPVKKNKLQATKICLLDKKENQKLSDQLIGFVDWYDKDRGFGVIRGYENEYFFLDNSIKLSKKYLHENDICVFNYIPSPKKKGKFNAIEIYFIDYNEKNYEIRSRVQSALQSIEKTDNDKYYNFIKKVFSNIPKEIYPNSIRISQKYMLSLFTELNAFNHAFTFIKDNSQENLYEILFFESNSTISEKKIIDSVVAINYINNENEFKYIKHILQSSGMITDLKIEGKYEYIFELWSNELINEIDTTLIAQYINNNFNSIDLKSVVFSRVLNEQEQISILKELSELITEDNYSRTRYYGQDKTLKLKFEKIQNIDTITSNAKTTFKNLVFEKNYERQLENVNAINQDFKWLNFNISLFEQSSLIEKIKIIESIVTLFKLKPNRGTYSNNTLIEVINKKGFAYIHNNLSLFPTNYEETISSFYYISKKYNGYGWQKVYETSKQFDNLITLIKELAFDISEEAITEYFQNYSSDNLEKEVYLVIEFERTKKLFNIQTDKELINILNNSLALIIFNDRDNVFANYFDKINLIKSLSENLFQELIETTYQELPIKEKMKLWLYDIYGQFNYEEFGIYYFVLNKTERNIFNKKAKAIMGEELKQSMLKRREPWENVSDNLRNEKEYKATWRSIWFEDGSIKFCKDTEGNFSSSFAWDFSEEKFNLLFDFISGRRLDDIIVFSKNDKITNVIGLEELEELIWKVQIQREFETYGTINTKGKSLSRIPNNILLRNKSIQLLNKLQLDEFEPTRVLERAYNIASSSGTVDISLLYSIPTNKTEIAIIWESLELEKSKATHIFKCNRNEYREIFNDIESYLQGNTKVRSSLNSSNYIDVENQKKLRYLCSINHDNFDYNKWENSLFEILPELNSKI